MRCSASALSDCLVFSVDCRIFDNHIADEVLQPRNRVVLHLRRDVQTVHDPEHKIYYLHLFFVLFDEFLPLLFVSQQLREQLNKLIYFIQNSQAVLIGQLGQGHEVEEQNFIEGVTQAIGCKLIYQTVDVN